jgi:hypothetical protein
MGRRGYDPNAETIDLYEDEITNPDDYQFYKALSKRVGKLITTAKRPKVPPANALIVKRKQLEDHPTYLRLKEQAAREKRELWIEDEEEPPPRVTLPL